MNTPTETLLTTALQLAANGVSVVAVGQDKRTFSSWKHLQSEIASEQDIRRMMIDTRTKGVAAICGKVSGGLLVLDFDVPGYYENWCDQVGEIINRLPVQRTGSGCFQVACRCDDPGGNDKLAYHPNPDELTGREVAIETRGEGGYAVVPPSLHPSGNRYEYITPETFGDAPHLGMAEVNFMLHCARQLCTAPLTRQAIESRKAEQAKAKPIDRSQLNGEVSVIDAWNTLIPIRTMLERAGYTADPQSSEYTRPGDDASAGGVVIFDNGRSYHHSTNDLLHDGKHSQDSFSVFLACEHGGDLSEAVKAAAREMGIEHKPLSAADAAGMIGEVWRDRTVETPASETQSPSLAPLSIASLIRHHPKLSPPVIDGVLRSGETANIIAASKVGKSWLMYGLMIDIATGRRWLDAFQCNAGRVLLIDNELHPQTIANRLPKVANALGVPMADLAESIDVLPLRGKGITLERLASFIDKIEPGTYRAIVLDAWYRFIPKGLSENSNADIMGLYNLLDQYAAQTGAAIIAVHHASKGAQGDKAVTDVGAGAGAQSRAADAHVVLRPHEDDGCVVLEAAVRSFAPIEPVGLRWEFPVWRRDGDLNTGALKDRKTKAQQRQAHNDAEGKKAIIDALRAGPLTVRKIRDMTGISKGRAERLLTSMTAGGIVTFNEVKVRGQSSREYTLAD